MQSNVLFPSRVKKSWTDWWKKIGSSYLLIVYPLAEILDNKTIKRMKSGTTQWLGYNTPSQLFAIFKCVICNE